MHCIISLLLLAVSGSCWPLSESKHEFGFITARDSQPLGSSAANGSVIPPRVIYLSKTINTTLTGVIVVITLATYGLITAYTTQLSNEIILPTKFIEDNVSALFAFNDKTWPERPEKLIGNVTHRMSMFLRGENMLAQQDQQEQHHEPHEQQEQRQQEDGESTHWLRLQGYLNLPAITKPILPKNRSMTKFNISSPVMRSLVQTAIWNSISFWLVIVMFFNTLVYNGFVTDQFRDLNDSILRLAFISAYALASFLYQIQITRLLYRNFTYIGLQACWVLICERFMFVLPTYAIEYPDKTHFGWTYDFKLFGRMERQRSYQRRNEPNNPKEPEDLNFRMKELNTACPQDQVIKALRDAEKESYGKSTDLLLERTLANVVVLLGICLATGLAPWTSTRTSDATSTQLGSYALLLSISTGLVALVSGIGHLKNATQSAKKILELHEKAITAAWCDAETTVDFNNVTKHQLYSTFFASGIEGQSQLTWWGLCRLASYIPRTLYGQLVDPSMGAIATCIAWPIYGSALLLVPKFFEEAAFNQGKYCFNANMHSIFYKEGILGQYECGIAMNRGPYFTI